MAQHVIEITVTKDGLKEATVKRLVKLLEKDLGKTAEVTSRKVEYPDSRPDRFAAAFGLIGEAKSELESLKEELEEWKNNLPENLQSGSKAEELDEAVSSLEDIIGDMETLEGRDSDVTFPAMM